MSQYLGKKQHGYWWLHCNGTLQRTLINYPICIKCWYVRCELDWYRMMKEYKMLAEGPLEPLVA